MNESAEPKSDRRCQGQKSPLASFRAFEPPTGAADHFRQARIELLKGVREIIDRRIDHLSQGPHKGTRINVD